VGNAEVSLGSGLKKSSQKWYHIFNTKSSTWPTGNYHSRPRVMRSTAHWVIVHQKRVRRGLSGLKQNLRCWRELLGLNIKQETKREKTTQYNTPSGPPQVHVYCKKNSIRICMNHTLFHTRDIVLWQKYLLTPEGLQPICRYCRCCAEYEVRNSIKHSRLKNVIKHHQWPA
jgi:hypothetical protein